MKARPILCALVVAVASGSATAREREPRPQDERAGKSEDDAVDSDWRRPLSSRNQFPLSLLVLRLKPERARSLEPGATDLRLHFDYSNVITDQRSETSRLTLDLEYLRTEIELRRGVGSGLEVGASLPFLFYYGGFLDPFVGGFHEAFGLPNFLRGRTENGLVRYDLVRDGRTVLQGEEPLNGIGDLTLHAKKTLLARGPSALAIRGALKLPTGDVASLSGSGAADGAFGASFERVGRSLGVYLDASYHLLGDSDELPTTSYASVTAGLDYRFKPRVAASLQFHHARPAFDGELDILRSRSQQVALGLRWRRSDRFVYEWRFVEDLSDVAPDFTFAFSMEIRFRRAELARSARERGRE